MISKFNSNKTLNYCILLLLITICAQETQAIISDSHVANWKDNKTASFLLMFDDGMTSAYQVAIPELLKRNMIATFYVNPGGNKWANPTVEAPNQWENLIPKTGMVYGNHTWTHNGAADLNIEDNEIRQCQEKIMSIFYTDSKPHLISYGQPGVTTWYSYGAELTAILAKYNLISRPTFEGHGAVYHLQTIKQMLTLADNAIASKGMEYLITHGVERRPSEGDPNWGYQDFWALNKDTLRGVLDGLAARRDSGDLWITDHISQYKYQMERDNMPAFQVQKSNDSVIQLTMTGTLDPDLYDLPLTVITQVPASWVSAYITQGAKTYSVPVMFGLAQYDAFPNGELITVKKNTDPTAPTGMASSVYLIQPGGSGAIWNGVAGTVVDLTLEDKSLNEWYKTTTFNVGDEIWLIKGTYIFTDTIATQTTEKIYGGFTGTEQTVGARAKGTNAWDFTNETIIDGNNLVRGFVSNTGALIDGLTIQNCKYVGSIPNTGTAAKISNSSTLQNCIVSNNTTTGTNSAGGVFLTTNGKLLNSYIQHNSNTTTTQNGGGVFVSNVATVDGCTITNNTAGNAGGGISIEGQAGGTVVNNCIVSNNECKTQGGGCVNTYNTTAFTGTALTFSNCTISSNLSKTNGGGMYFDNPGTDGNYNVGAVDILNCIISQNTAPLNGGGIYMNRGRTNINGCTINNNVSNAARNDANGGGGIFVNTTLYGRLTLSNSLIRNNSTTTGTNHGSAINTNVPSTFTNCLITGNTGPTFVFQKINATGTYENCTFTGNLMNNGTEAGMYLGYNMSVISTFTNCLFYKCTTNPIGGTPLAGKNPVVTYCGFELAAVPTAYVNKTGCITGLTSSAFTDATNGDWSLSPTSAAINAGTTIAAVTTDILGIVRPQGAGYDMGAYERTDLSTGLEKINQFECYSDNHSVNLKGMSIGTQLAVYTLTGVLLLNETANSSDVSISLSPGFYLVTVVDAGKNFTQKVIVK